jgi:cysteine-rich repeat protein
MTNRRVCRESSRPSAGLLIPSLALLLSAALAPACGPEFESCEAHRSCPTSSSGGGDAGGAESGAGSGNNGGSELGGAAAGGASGAQSAGAGGEGGSDETCADEGAVECASAASPVVRTCTKGVWLAEPCAKGSLCDSSDQSCKPVIDGCAELHAGDAFCEGIDARRVCGPDLVTTTDQLCDGVCVDGSCRKPACGDGKLESGETCDDANVEPGDGCSATCRAEPVAVELGRTFGCALLSDQRLKCWGDNAVGQLGLGDVLPHGDAPGELGASLKATLTDVTAFAVGARHACAVSKGETWCWGENTKYQLGAGSLSPAFSRVPLKVNVGTTVSDPPLALAAGEDFSCALLSDHSLRCWGTNTGGVFGAAGAYLPSAPQAALPRLTLGTMTASIDAGASLCADSSAGLVCSGARFPSSAFSVDLGSDFALAGVRSGAHHDCAWSAAGDVKCWGDTLDPLGLDGEYVSPIDTATAPRVPLSDAVSTLDVGDDATCAVLGEGNVECWGATQSGVLGRPDLSAGAGVYVGDEAGEMAELAPLDLGSDSAARAVAVGQGFACALLERGALKCWGNNASGQLGQGDTETRGDEPGELGDALPDTELD